MRKNQVNKMSILNKMGIIVYPIYDLKKKCWFIEVDNNEKKTVYNKSIGDKQILRGKEFEAQINAVYESLYTKILKKEEDVRK